MQIIKGNYGKVFICDCMDEQYGLPSLKPKSFELCITDFPYNVDVGRLKKDHERLSNGGQFKNKVFYDDIIPDYPKWREMMYNSIERVSLQMLFFVGEPNFVDWVSWKKPKEIFIHYKSNGASFTHSCRFNRFEHIIGYDDRVPEYEHMLGYGKFRPFQFYSNVFDIPLDNSRLRKMGLKHPCPKDERLIREIIQRCDPKNVIDPLLGSGTTAQICEELGKPYMAYERDQTFIEDIRVRIAQGISDHAFRKKTKQLLTY